MKAIAREFEKFNNEKLQYLYYSSSNINRMFKARLMNLEEHVAHMEGQRNACIILVIKPERRDYFRGVGVDANVIFNWT